MPDFHTAQLSLSQLDWNWNPTILGGVILITIAYLVASGPTAGKIFRDGKLPAWRRVTFVLGSIFVLLTLVSPLDQLSDDYLFSAHMLQHMLLVYVVPPLWLAGFPVWKLKKNLRFQALLLAGRFFKRLGFIRKSRSRLLVGFGQGWDALLSPVAGFVIFNTAMWAWHIPGIYDKALEIESLHVVEHLMFIGTALLWWRPVLDVHAWSARPANPGAVYWKRAAYIFASLFPCTGLAALITLTNWQLYPFYGLNALQWGLTPLSDQILGGLIMWVPSDVIMMVLFTLFFYLLLSQSDRKSELGKKVVQGDVPNGRN